MLSTFFASCTLMHGTYWSITFSENTLFTTRFVVLVLKVTNNGIIAYANIQQIRRLLVPTTILLTFLHSIHCCIGLIGVGYLIKTHCLQLILMFSLKKELTLAVNWKVFNTKNSTLDFFRILYIAAWDFLV